MTPAAFPERERVDAHDKVLGRTRYAADLPFPGLLYAMTVPATIARGTLAALPTAPALRVPGVVRVLTAADFPPPAAPAGGMPAPPTLTDEIAYRGQPVALVLAESLEAAIEGAEALEPVYAQQSFAPLIDSAGAARAPAEPVRAGDAGAALGAARVTLQERYVSPAQHHNPIEMLSTTAVWADGMLTIHEGTQAAGPVRAGVARALGLDPAKIAVSSPYTGGAFGQKGGVQRQTAIVAQAAILTGRPVKLVMPRGQIFHNATFRPLSRHQVTLGATAERPLSVIRYDADHQQSRTGQFPPSYHESTRVCYDVPDYDGTSANVRIDTQDPGYMRAPHPHPAHFALESAIDELSYKLGRDPVALRLEVPATKDPVSGHPLSSCLLSDCLRVGAQRFGWDRRSAAPRSMRLADGTQVGWGVAGGAYPVNTTAAIATLRIGADGSTRFAVTGHEFGQGIRTVIAQLLQAELGIDASRLDIAIGDTRAAPQHTTAGSWGTNSVVPAVAKACERLKAAMAELLAGRPVEGGIHRQLAAVKRPFLQVEVSTLAAGQDPSALDRLRAGGFAKAGPEYPGYASHSYIAHFVEVRVEPRTRRVRVPRVVSVADCGRVVSPRTAASQVRGGVVMAIGSALREETEVDPRYGGWLNADLADYVVPVNADIGDIEVEFIDRPDPLTNAIGTKGLGEVSMVGAAGAIANAVYHATGIRVRKMPIRIEDLL
jgi:xanthine dehydrogenase YagR molybdenum-binding subunit